MNKPKIISIKESPVSGKEVLEVKIMIAGELYSGLLIKKEKSKGGTNEKLKN